VSDQNQIPHASTSLVIPPFGGSPALSLELTKTKEAEARLIEAKTVSPITYADLEHCFNESYRELKRHYATIGLELANAEKAQKTAKSVFLIDQYPELLAKSKLQDNGDTREAYLMRNKEYTDALDRINMLKAMEAFVEGRIKVMERVCAYMKKQMDLVIRSGLSGRDLYNTQGRR
jgi:hypothetical protein